MKKQLIICLLVALCLTIAGTAFAAMPQDRDDFVQMLYDMPLGQVYTMPDYMQTAGADITNAYWFYTGNLGAVKADITVRKDIMSITKIQLTATTNELFFNDLVPVINGMYLAPTDTSDSPDKKSCKWKYSNYTATLDSQMNQNFTWETKFYTTFN